MVRGPKPKDRVCLPRKEHRLLKHLARQTTAPYAQVLRAKIVVAAHEHPDWTNAAIARHVGCATRTVRRWRRRWRRDHALSDAPRSGGPRFFFLGPTSRTHRVGVHTATQF